jgi:hypothetical protein
LHETCIEEENAYAASCYGIRENKN